MRHIHSRKAVLLISIFCTFFVFPVWGEETHAELETKKTVEGEDETDTGTYIYPLIKYDFASLGSQGLHSPGAGLLLMQDELMLLGFYTRHTFAEPLQYGYPRIYHSIDVLIDDARENHQYLLLFKSEAETPLFGGLSSFQTAAVYGYRLLNTQTTSLVLGGGLAVSDFGIELENGRPWPLIPVPLLRFRHESRLITASFDFITSPNLSFTLLPEKSIRLKGDLRMDQFRDIHDLIFEAALMYRFFEKDHPIGDFAGIEAGVNNNAYGFAVDGQPDPLEVNYYSVFGTLDLTLLKCTGGYVFRSRERYGNDTTENPGTGMFLSFEGMYRF